MEQQSFVFACQNVPPISDQNNGDKQMMKVGCYCSSNVHNK